MEPQQKGSALQLTLILEVEPNLSHSVLIWQASSRVGAITSTIGPSRPGCRYGCALMCTIPGSRNASVLPEPVREMPTTSRPESASGQPCAWIGDGSVYPAFITSASTYSGNEASSNVRTGFGMPGVIARMSRFVR
eukprot:SAG22_NODE_143_length_17909_cov_34.254969_12_plen_136_part_00